MGTDLPDDVLDALVQETGVFLDNHDYLTPGVRRIYQELLPHPEKVHTCDARRWIWTARSLIWTVEVDTAPRGGG